MASVHTLQNNFTAGEVAPQMWGRADFPKYANACETLENLVVLPQGGVTRRPGSLVVCETDGAPLIVPFVVSETAAYSLIFDHLRLLIAKDKQLITTTSLFGATLWAQSGLNNFVAANVNDGSLGATAFDANSSATGSTLTFDSGVGVQKNFVGVTVSVSAASVAHRWDVEYSDNGTDYTRVGGFYPSATATTVRWPHAKPHRYWRLKLVSSPAAGPNYQEVQFLSAVSVVTPYATSDLPTLRWAQSADALILAHPSYDPRRLERYGDALWQLVTIVFDAPASLEYGARTGSITLTPAATSGAGVNMTASASFFLAADVGREVLVTAGASSGARAKIVSVTSATVAVADISVAFASTSAVAGGSWKLTLSPRAAVTPDFGGLSLNRDFTRGTTVNFTASAASFRAEDVGKFIICEARTFRVKTFTSATVVATTALSDLPASLFLSPTTDPHTYEAGSWSLEEAAWSSTNGFPRVVAFHEQRLCFGGSAADPTTFWQSRTGDYYDFAFGPDDSDGVTYTLVGKLHQLKWLLGAKQLFVGTGGAEWRISGGGVDDPITPTNLVARLQTAYGSSGVIPVFSGEAVLFVPISGRKIREFAYSFETDSYSAPDLLLLAGHLGENTTGPPGVQGIALQQEPAQTVWAWRGDQTLLGCTYLRDQNIVAWHRHVLDPAAGPASPTTFSVAALPYQQRVGSAWEPVADQVWYGIHRIISGVTKTYVEYLDPGDATRGTIGVWDRTPLDASVAFDLGGLTATVLPNLAHLEGRSVTVIGTLSGGALAVETGTVSSGAVTVTSAFQKGFIGLAYTTTLKPVPLEVRSADGTRLFRPKRYAEVGVKLVNAAALTAATGVATLDGVVIAPSVLGALRTEDVTISLAGWDHSGQPTLAQSTSQPFPLTVTALAAVVELGE